MNILIVDDDRVDRECIKRALKKQQNIGYVVEVETVDESLSAMKQQKFDVVFLDYNLPQRNGLELLLELKGDALVENTAFIMMSTEEEERLVHACLDAGAKDYLAKTEITPERLEQSILKARASYEK